MKTTCLILSLIVGLSSCTINKNISKGTDLTEAVIREKLKPGMNYRITLYSGRISDVKIISTDSMRVYGVETIIVGMGDETRSYNNSWESIHKNASRIDEIKKSRGLTFTAAILATIGGVAFFLYSDWYSF